MLDEVGCLGKKVYPLVICASAGGDVLNVPGPQSWRDRLLLSDRVAPAECRAFGGTEPLGGTESVGGAEPLGDSAPETDEHPALLSRRPHRVLIEWVALVRSNPVELRKRRKPRPRLRRPHE